MPYPYWQYFLSLEAAFDTTTRYVEVDVHNYGTYSTEYARLLLSTCSEVDVVCKLLCEKVAPQSKVENINDYRKVILKHYPKFTTVKALVPRYGLEVLPWQDWSATQSPTWWKSYNKVKHQRDTYFSQANLESVLNALAGLFCMLLYYYQPEFYDFKLQPFASVFGYENTPDYWITEGGVKLPDF